MALTLVLAPTLLACGANSGAHSNGSCCCRRSAAHPPGPSARSAVGDGSSGSLRARERTTLVLALANGKRATVTMMDMETHLTRRSWTFL